MYRFLLCIAVSRPVSVQGRVPRKVPAYLLDSLIWNNPTCQMLLTFHDSLLKKTQPFLLKHACMVIDSFVADGALFVCVWSLERRQVFFSS